MASTRPTGFVIEPSNLLTKHWWIVYRSHKRGTLERYLAVDDTVQSIDSVHSIRYFGSLEAAEEKLAALVLLDEAGASP